MGRAALLISSLRATREAAYTTCSGCLLGYHKILLPHEKHPDGRRGVFHCTLLSHLDQGQLFPTARRVPFPAFALSRGSSSRQMIATVKVQVAPLAERRQVLWPHIRFVVLVARPAIGIGYAEVGNREYHARGHTQPIPVQRAAPLADPLGALLTNGEAKLLPVIRVVGVKLAHG